MVNRLLLLNGIAIINVILFHATGFGFWAMFFLVDRYRPVTSPNFDDVGTATYYLLRLTEQYIAFTIPAFLFVSGFFVSVLAGRRRSGLSGEVVSARIRTLLVPYLFWSGITLGVLALQGRIYPAARYLRMMLTGSMNPTYYFVPLLVQLYLLAPVLVWMARRRWQALLIATAVLQVCVYALQYTIVLGIEHSQFMPIATAIPKWLFVAHLFWFTLGIVIGLEQQTFKPFIRRYRWHFLAAAATLFVVGLIEWEWVRLASGSQWVENRMTLVDGLYAGTVILAFLGLEELTLPFSGVLVDLAGKSFGIYLAHGFVMDYTTRALYHFAPWILGQQPLLLALEISLGLGIPLLLMSMVKRTQIRPMYPYVFG
jgi:membrane-bound acyltransferase YfiQ involved in biofilm formation